MSRNSWEAGCAGATCVVMGTMALRLPWAIARVGAVLMIAVGAWCVVLSAAMEGEE